jgi:hypothetical protein
MAFDHVRLACPNTPIGVDPYHGSVLFERARLEPGNKSLYIPGVGFTAEILPSLSGHASGERKPDTFPPKTPGQGSWVFTWVAHKFGFLSHICHPSKPSMTQVCATQLHIAGGVSWRKMKSKK